MVQVRIALDTRLWTWINHLAIWGSAALWFLYMLAYMSILPSTNNVFGVQWQLLPSGQYWLTVLLAVGASVLPYLLTVSAINVLQPDASRVICEMERRGVPPFERHDRRSSADKARWATEGRRAASLLSFDEMWQQGQPPHERQYTGYAFAQAIDGKQLLETKYPDVHSINNSNSQQEQATITATTDNNNSNSNDSPPVARPRPQNTGSEV